MHKKLIIGLISLLSASFIGCSDKTVTENTNQNINNEVIAESSIKEDSKRSNKEMYEIHKELIPRVKEYYESLGGNVIEEKDERASDYKDITYISHTNYDNRTIGEFTALDYGLSFYQDGRVNFIMAGMYMNIDGESYKDGSFKIEETPFYELIKIFGADKLDYTSINEKINDYFQGNGSDLVQRNEGQFSERINLSSGEIAYIININP